MTVWSNAELDERRCIPRNRDLSSASLSRTMNMHLYRVHLLHATEGYQLYLNFLQAARRLSLESNYGPRIQRLAERILIDHGHLMTFEIDPMDHEAAELLVHALRAYGCTVVRSPHSTSLTVTAPDQYWRRPTSN